MEFDDFLQIVEFAKLANALYDLLLALNLATFGQIPPSLTFVWGLL